MFFGEIDYIALNAVQLIANNNWDFFFRAISFIGNPFLWIILASLIYWLGKEKKAIWLFNLLLINSAIIAFLKFVFALPRPDSEIFRVIKEGIMPKIFYSGSVEEFGFPSGHSSTIAAICFFFRKKIKKIYLPLLILVPLLVAFSRMYLGMHFLSDVLAGLFIGLMVAYGHEKMQKMFRKYEFKVKKIYEESAFLLISIISLGAIFVLDVPLLALTMLGFYAGFYAKQEIGFKQIVPKEKEVQKLSIGFFSLALMVFIASSSTSFAPLIAFLGGVWVSVGYPLFYEWLNTKD